MGSLEKKMHLIYMSSLSILFQAKSGVLQLVQGMKCLNCGMGRGECLIIKEHDQIKIATLIKGHSTSRTAVARSSNSNGGNQQLWLGSSEHQRGNKMFFCFIHGSSWAFMGLS